MGEDKPDRVASQSCGSQPSLEVEALLASERQATQYILSELAETREQLDRIRRSLGWRLLSRFGPLKYGLLLPLLGILSGKSKSSSQPPPQAEDNPETGENGCACKQAPDPSIQTVVPMWTNGPVSGACGRNRMETPARPDEFRTGSSGLYFMPGRCLICGNQTAFFFGEETEFRGSLHCAVCITTSRYRSIARGILRAVKEITGIDAPSLSSLSLFRREPALAVYDTQVSFYDRSGSYPVPDLLARAEWIDVRTSLYRPILAPGASLGPGATNQNLESLTYDDASLDIVITSDVMEHVRLDDRAHSEILRVLRPGGVYLFTVPHLRDRRETMTRVMVVDPSDPQKDRFLMEKEYHGDRNSREDRALTYRIYGMEILDMLESIGFAVDYTYQNFPETAIFDTELFYCRKR